MAELTTERVAHGAVDRLCDYDAWNAPGDYDATAERIAEFMAHFVRIAAERLAGAVEHGARGEVGRDMGGGEERLIASPSLKHALDRVLDEVILQDRKVVGDPPTHFGADRHGVRGFITSLEDETREAREAWDREKKPPGGHDPSRWPDTTEELTQVTAIGLRALAALEAR